MRNKKWIVSISDCKLCYILLLLVSINSYSQYNPAVKKKRIWHHISVGPVISFFKNQPKVTANTKAKAGFNAAYKIDILLSKKTSFITGLEYFSQGVFFKGYYSAPGYTYLFDETYSYTHEIRYSEAQLPLYFKLALNKEKDKSYTAYIFGGVGFRYILNSYTIIVNDSTNTTPYDGKGKLSFENFVFAKSMNANYQAGFGAQKNFRATGKAMFIEFIYRYGISRLHYNGHNNSNDLNIKDASLGITFGFRF